MNWDNVEMIRNAQASNRKRFDEEHIAVQEKIEEAIKSETFNQLAVPRLTELETMIFKMRSELIDYIVAHGLVDGLILDGVLQPVVNGKIVLTKELIETITEKLGYFKEEDVLRFVETYLPAHDYVSDDMYVHTDNNFRDEDVIKLDGIEEGAEVNKVINVLFNGVSVLDNGTRVATITITPEDVKQWYESNPNTNAFTDKEKAKLAGISDGAEVNRVDDVILNGRSVLDENKKALLTKELIKEAYEANPDTNAFTDDEKQTLANLKATRVRILSFVEEAIKNIQVSDPSVFPDGEYNIQLKMDVLVKDDSGHQRTFKGLLLTGLGLLSGGYIGAGTALFCNNKTASSSLLQSASLSMDDYNKPNVMLVFDMSKDEGFTPATAEISNVSLDAGIFRINDIKVNGTSVEPDNGVVDITVPTANDYVPYSGATRNVNLNGNDLEVGGIVIGEDCTVTFSQAGDYDSLLGVTENDAAFTNGTKTLPVLVGAPTLNSHATNKEYVDGKFIPYEGATTTVDLNRKDLVNVDKAWCHGPMIACQDVSVRSDYNVTSSGAKLVAEDLGGIRFEKGTSTELQHVSVGTPTENNHATTKKYVDEAVAGAGACKSITNETVFATKMTNASFMTFSIESAESPSTFDCLEIKSSDTPVVSSSVSVSTYKLDNMKFIAQKTLYVKGYYAIFDTGFVKCSDSQNISVRVVIQQETATSADVTIYYKYEDYADGSITIGQYIDYTTWYQLLNPEYYQFT